LRGGYGGEELDRLELDGLVERDGDEELGIDVRFEERLTFRARGGTYDGREWVGGRFVETG
jgi:hypothetical protein